MSIPVRRFALGAMVALMSLAGTVSAEAKPFTAKTLVTLDRVSDPRVSPDGRWAVYGLRSMDYEANKASNALWLIDLNDRSIPPQRLDASDGGITSARWSRDSKAVYFLSSRVAGINQVFRLDLSNRTVTQATFLPIDVESFVLSPDGKGLAVSYSGYPDCPSLDCDLERRNTPAPDKSTGQVYTKLFIRHWDSWADGQRNRLGFVRLDDKGVGGQVIPLTTGFDGDVPSKPFGDDSEYAFTPDSSAVVFSARLAGRTEAWSTNFDLWRVSLDGQGLTNLTAANKAWDTGPVFSPDGKFMAYRAMKRPGFEADRWQVVLKNLNTGVVRELAADWDRSADSLAWSADSRTVFVTAQDVGQVRIFSMDIGTGEVKARTTEGHVSAFSLTPKGMVFARDTLAGPAQIYVQEWNTEAPARVLTDHNKAVMAEADLGAYEQFRFPGWNGETVYGYLVKPANFDPARKYPVAFLIHGGPQGSFGNLFHYRWNAQTYASAGYAVVMIDFHGSTGYGQAFTDAISQHWGDRPQEDLEKGWDHVLKTYSFLDGGRACALGGSYGGYMVNWIAGNWKRPWKCLVNHDGIFDTRFMGYSTEELWFTEWENGGTPFRQPGNYERFNPVNHVQDWTVPMLVIQGGKDFRVPAEQGIATFTALQRKGVESRFLYFPDENHWVLKAQNSVQWHNEVLGWLDRWTAPKPKGR
ncbi:MAG: S9 family peptidase [Caulobacter sp.]|nr:S9 family peptidase [Caulobacter sp.]